MGTTLLFPQDCLRISKSRHGNNLSDAFSCLPIATDSTIQLFDSRFFYTDQTRRNFTPYDGVGAFNRHQARNSFAPSPLQREVERRKPKSCTSRLLNGVFESRSSTGTRPCKSVQSVFLDKKKKNGKKGSFDAEVNGKKGFSDADVGKSNLGPPHSDLSMLAARAMVKGDKYNKLQNVMTGAMRPRRSCDNRCDFVMPPPKGPTNQVPALGLDTSLTSLNIAESYSLKGTYVKQPPRGNAVGGGPTRLRRASTDSQIVQHLGHYRSEVLEIPCGQGKSFTRTTSMSLPEKWAGPAYSASPAPSSLPLPKFSLHGQKMPSLDVSPLLVERQKSNITKPVDASALLATGSLHVDGELDVAYATKSLRRMLKLDLS